MRLLHELRGMVTDPYVQWDRQPARPNSSHAWAQALEKVVQRPPRQLPLTSHGYLRKIAYDIANDMDKYAERRHIEAERSGQVRSENAQERDRWMPGEEDFARVRAALKGTGRKM